MSGFNLWALDKDFNLVALLYPIDVQWTRRYYEPGTFSISLIAKDYDTSFKYVYSPERPEFGKITQTNFQQKQGYYEVYISGFFLESELAKMPVYPWSQRGNISNQPSWREYSGTVEDVAIAYFNAFKVLKATMLDGTQINADLGMISAESKGRGKQITIPRQPKILSEFLYEFLFPEGMSYRVTYNFENNQRIFEIVKGRDLTSEGHGDNNQVVLSSTWGNVKDINVVLSEGEACNAAVAYGTRVNADFRDMWIEADKEGNQSLRSRYYSFNGDYANAVWDGSTPDNISFALTDEKTDPDYPITDHDFGDYGTYKYRQMPFSSVEAMATHYNRLAEEACRKKITARAIIENVDYGTMLGSYEYQTDYDLGDIVSVEIPELEFSKDLRISSIYETMSGGKWNIELELGEPIKEVKK